MATSASPVDPVDRQLNLTPTLRGQATPCPKTREAHTNAEHPRMRRRRSSINIGVSPMALIKSPVRSAGAALQRTGFMSPTRHHAASVSMNEALENNSLFGRLRSGSVGGVANPPKRLRRAVRCPVPLAPPPSVPLPALPPPSPTVKRGGSLLPPAILVPVSRQPLATKTLRTENVGALFSPTLPPATLPGPGYAQKMPFKMSQGLSSPHDDIIDEVMDEY